MTLPPRLLASLLCTILGMAVALPAGAARTHLPDEQHAPAHVKEKLAKLRAKYSHRKYRFKIGYTGVSHRSIESIAGLKLPPAAKLLATAKEVNERARKKRSHHKPHQQRGQHTPQLHSPAPGPGGPAAPQPDVQPDPTPEPNCAAAAHHDLRKKHLVTAVRDQGGCGDCWNFAAVGAFESSWSIVNASHIDASEQQILDCNGKWNCQGGWYAEVFQMLEDRGVAPESEDVYTAKEHACAATPAGKYFASNWAYVSDTVLVPPVADMKAALCEHGALSVAVHASDAFANYTGGVFNEDDDKGEINHGVAIIGWDDAKQAWLIKNSWGTAWGEDGGDPSATLGYMWIAYGSNRIGTGAAWVDARPAEDDRRECDVRVMEPKPTVRIPHPEPFHSTQLFAVEADCKRYAATHCAKGNAEYRFTVDQPWGPACQ
jgi:cathepsin L